MQRAAEEGTARTAELEHSIADLEGQLEGALARASEKEAQLAEMHEKYKVRKPSCSVDSCNRRVWMVRRRSRRRCAASTRCMIVLCVLLV